MDNDLKGFLIKELKNRYNCEVKYEDNCIVAKKASKPDAPIHLKDIVDILKNAAQKFKLGQHDLAYSINDDGSIMISESLN